eukprot:TRINITY_DN50842_c0_g1_i1.p1 TRINITY_DN50842_c0_g1~~TRINITY_DN50842_c0_g1_i1.p1  ORF type:complete len:493 (+),score=50.52 TRINITY_DN50842_c0_g1_i1:196-1479(+)
MLFELSLTNFNNVQYVAPLSVGGQTLPVIYDTGSFEVIVLSALCSKCSKELSMYDSRKSSSFVSDSGVVADHAFGSGPVRSERGFDMLRIGDGDSPLAFPHAPFWQVISHGIEAWDENAHFSGIVGLGQQDYVPQGFGQVSPTEKILLASLGVSRFAICLGRYEPGAPGVLTLWRDGGFSALSNFGGSPPGFASLHVIGDLHWNVRMTSLRVGNIQHVDPCQPSCSAIIDSGTSLIAVPTSAQSLVDTLTAAVQSDCSNLQELPIIELQLDGVPIQLPPHAYVIQQAVSTSPNSSMWGDLFQGGPTRQWECAAGFMTIDRVSDLGPVWILGMPFLRYYHTVFDRYAKMIHISPSTPTCSPPTAFSLNPPTNNTTHFSAHSAVAAAASASAATAYTSRDFEPTQVDIAGLRVPSWSGASSGRGREMRS